MLDSDSSLFFFFYFTKFPTRLGNPAQNYTRTLHLCEFVYYVHFCSFLHFVTLETQRAFPWMWRNIWLIRIPSDPPGVHLIPRNERSLDDPHKAIERLCKWNISPHFVHYLWSFLWPQLSLASWAYIEKGTSTWRPVPRQAAKGRDKTMLARYGQLHQPPNDPWRQPPPPFIAWDRRCEELTSPLLEAAD